MNPRERKLLVVLLSILGGGAVLLVGGQWFVKPLKDLSAKIATLKDENEKLDFDRALFQREWKKLELARRKSLPANPETAGSEYINYLKSLLHESGLSDVDLTRTAAAEMKVAKMIPGVKNIGHQIISFQVRAKGELKHLVKAMAVMQKTPYEHRIKNLSIDRADASTSKNASQKLNINMIVEALLVADTSSKPGIPPGIDPAYLILDGIAAQTGVTPLGWGLLGSTVMLKQAMPMPAARDYADVALKNIFVGAIPGPDKSPGATQTGPKAPDEDVPKYIRLVTTVPGQKTAYLSNLVYKTRETKLIAKPRSGYEFFRVTDEDGEYVFFKAKVLRVDSRDVYFQVKNQVYSIHIGKSLAEAMEYPLSIDQMDDLDLGDVYDRDWAKEEMAKEHGKSAKTRKGGRER